MKHNLAKGISVLLLLLSFTSCRPGAWQAAPDLAQNKVAVDKALTADPQLEALIVPYRQQVTSKMSEVVGTTPAALTKGEYQSPLGNLVVDLQLEQSLPLYGKPIDLSLTTNGGLREPLPQGNITRGHVFELMPFENELVVLTLKGETVQALFDYAARTKFAPIGNATYTVQNGKPGNIRIGGAPFDPQRSYTLVTSDYLAGGGDNLAMLKEATRREQVGLLLRDAIMQHISRLTAAGKPVVADTTTRVTLLP